MGLILRNIFWGKNYKSIFRNAKNHVTLILNFEINLHENHVTFNYKYNS